MPDFYRILQVDPTADAEVIEAAYKRLARKFHPDVSARLDAEGRIRQLNGAWEVLGDPARRMAYDAERMPRARTRVRLVEPIKRERARKPEARHVAPSRDMRIGVPARRAVVVATAAGVGASLAIAVLAAQLFSAQQVEQEVVPPPAIVIVTLAREEPSIDEPVPRRATPTPAAWPPPLHYIVGEMPAQTPPQVDLFSRFVGAARNVTRRLQGPTPPYNPTPP